MALPLRYSMQSLWARRRTTLATAIGIALVVFVLASSWMLAFGVRRALMQSGSSDTALVLQKDSWGEGGSRLRQHLVGLAAAAPGVRRTEADGPLAVGEIVTATMLENRHDPLRWGNVQVRGVVPKSFVLRPAVRIVQGRAAAPGGDEAIVGIGVVDRFRGLRLGEGIELKKNRKLVIVGVFEADGSAFESEVWANLESVQGSIGYQTFVSSITARLEHANAFDAFAAGLQSTQQDGIDVVREVLYYDKISNEQATIIRGLGGIVTVIFALGAMLGAVITMHGAVSQRRREIAVLRALGFTPTAVLATFVLESALLALFGAVLGVGLSLLTPLFDFSTENFGTGREMTFHFVPSVPILFGSLALGLVVGLVGGLFPAFAAARVRPLPALRA
jgi:putative ABC transport system permease protein